MSIAGNREWCGRCSTLVDVSTAEGWENLGGLGLDDLDGIVCEACITPVERARVDAIVSAGCADWADLEEHLDVLDGSDLEERVGYLEGLGLERSIGYLDAKVAGLERVDLDELSGQVSGLETCVEAYALEGASDRERIEALEARVEALSGVLKGVLDLLEVNLAGGAS